MTLIVDAALLVASADSREPQLETLLKIRDEEEGPLVLPAPVAAEVACLEPGDYRTVADLDARYADLGLGLADCSIVVLAERYGTRRLFSFDERHCRTVAPLQGGSFVLLPADS